MFVSVSFWFLLDPRQNIVFSLQLDLRERGYPRESFDCCVFFKVIINTNTIIDALCWRQFTVLAWIRVYRFYIYSAWKNNIDMWCYISSLWLWLLRHLDRGHEGSDMTWKNTIMKMMEQSDQKIMWHLSVIVNFMVILFWITLQMSPELFAILIMCDFESLGSDHHTCKKRVMLRRWLFWPKKFAEKVRKSRQNLNRDKHV